jgi:hypothetical protein
MITRNPMKTVWLSFGSSFPVFSHNFSTMEHAVLLFSVEKEVAPLPCEYVDHNKNKQLYLNGITETERFILKRVGDVWYSVNVDEAGARSEKLGNRKINRWFENYKVRGPFYVLKSKFHEEEDENLPFTDKDVQNVTQWVKEFNQ